MKLFKEEPYQRPLPPSPLLEQASPSPVLPQPKVCVIGAGYWGKNLIRNFYNLGALAMVCDARPEVLAQVATDYPGTHTYPDLATALAEGHTLGVSSMVIATPSITHASVGTQALEAGYHVYIEKPLATTLADAEALVALAKHKQLKLMVGHLLMYHPAVVRIKEVVSSGRLGTLRFIQSDRLNYNAGRADRNALWDLAVHDLAMLQCILPDNTMHVQAASGIASGLHQRDTKVDMVQATFQYQPSGLQAMLQCSWLYPVKQVRFMVVGDEASVVLDDTLPMEQRLALHTRQPDGSVAIEPLPYLPLEPLKLECQHWLNCLRHNEQDPQSNHTNALAVVRLLEEIQAKF